MVIALLALTALATRAAIAATAAHRSRARLQDLGLPSGLTARSVTRDLAGWVRRRQRERQLERGLPDVLDGIARSLRSGASLRQALEEVAATATGLLRDDLGAIVADVHDGASIVDALETWPARRPVAGVRLATAALSLGAETGGASARAIDGVAATLRTNLGIAGEVRALSSQARLSALVIVLAPIAFAFLAATSDGGTAVFLLRTPLGLACLALGLGLDALGWLWMRRIVAAVA